MTEPKMRKHVIVGVVFWQLVWPLLGSWPSSASPSLTASEARPPLEPKAVGGADLSDLVVRPFEPEMGVRVLLILPLARQKSQIVRKFIDCLMAAR